MQTFFIVYFVAIFILFLPLKLRGKAGYNFLENKGFISVFAFKIHIFYATLSFLPIKLSVNVKGKKRFFIDLVALRNGGNFSQVFFRQLFDTLSINNLKSNLTFGTNNPFVTSMICGAFISSIMSSLAFVSHKKSIKWGQVTTYPNFLESRCFLSFTFSLSINLFWIIYSFFCALFTLVFYKKRQEKNK